MKQKRWHPLEFDVFKHYELDSAFYLSDSVHPFQVYAVLALRLLRRMDVSTREFKMGRFLVTTDHDRWSQEWLFILSGLARD